MNCDFLKMTRKTVHDNHARFFCRLIFMSITNFKSLSGDALLTHYMLGDEVEFDTDWFFEKYGFADGDLLMDLFYEYMEKVKKVDFRTNRTLRSNIALQQVVEKHILPKITPQIKLNYFTTCHNGIRRDSDNNFGITPRYVYVRLKDIFDSIYTDDQVRVKE